jgi:hypothetical protein
MKRLIILLSLSTSLMACKTQLPFKSISSSEGGGFTGATRKCSIDAAGNVSQTSTLKEESNVVFVRKLNKEEMKTLSKNTPVELILKTDFNQPSNYTYGVSILTEKGSNTIQWGNPGDVKKDILTIHTTVHQFCFK